MAYKLLLLSVPTNLSLWWAFLVAGLWIVWRDVRYGRMGYPSRPRRDEDVESFKWGSLGMWRHLFSLPLSHPCPTSMLSGGRLDY